MLGQSSAPNPLVILGSHSNVVLNHPSMQIFHPMANQRGGGFPSLDARQPNAFSQVILQFSHERQRVLDDLIGREQIDQAFENRNLLQFRVQCNPVEHVLLLVAEVAEHHVNHTTFEGRQVRLLLLLDRGRIVNGMVILGQRKRILFVRIVIDHQLIEPNLQPLHVTFLQNLSVYLPALYECPDEVLFQQSEPNLLQNEVGFLGLVQSAVCFDGNFLHHFGSALYVAALFFHFGQHSRQLSPFAFNENFPISDIPQIFYQTSPRINVFN
mmetsp:Transcript_20848/g.30909  ORF Transcript_20848/g.30909 Transcript_20848/m.30909 type:complete len:269 (-) Transcript_20848:336-1142(-)